MALRERIAINAHLPGPPALDMAQRLGVGSIRIDANWYDIQKGPDSWDWTLMDSVVYGARNRNLEVYATIGKTPGWLGGGDKHNLPPPLHEWEAFVHTIAERYQHNVWHWSIFNEPNERGYYDGPVEQYVHQTLIPAAKILHQIERNNRVAAPDLMTERDWPAWLKTCLTMARDHIDIVAVHSYQNDGRAVWDALGKPKKWWEPWREPSIRQVIQAAGCGDKPVWLTESGFESKDLDLGSETSQATAMDQLLEGLLGNPWVQRIFVYDLWADSLAPNHGVYRKNKSRKPASDVIQRWAEKG